MKSLEPRKSLVERVASSRHISRSARLRDLLLYLAGRVLDGGAEEIHEQEVGCQVFGRHEGYDTAADNIVRVHASMLRKRLEQYFAAEGADEPYFIDLPKGNYALVFREREALEPAAVPPPPIAAIPTTGRRRLWALLALAGFFACSTAYLLLRPAPAMAPAASLPSTVRQFWSQIFMPGRPADIVLDDAAVGLYQELTGKPVALSTYFDRSYLSNLPETAVAAGLDAQTASWVVLRRQSSFAGANVLWKLFQMGGQRQAVLRFARDYSFRELKANNAVLLGNSRSNPWVEPFEAKLGLRWEFDKATRTYYPVDSWDGGRNYQPPEATESREGYCAMALLPNLSQTGNILLIASTGGSAMNAGTDFLADEASLAALRKRLTPGKDAAFPYFEALIRARGRSGTPRDLTVVLCRPIRR